MKIRIVKNNTYTKKKQPKKTKTTYRHVAWIFITRDLRIFEPRFISNWIASHKTHT